MSVRRRRRRPAPLRWSSTSSGGASCSSDCPTDSSASSSTRRSSLSTTSTALCPSPNSRPNSPSPHPTSPFSHPFSPSTHTPPKLSHQFSISTHGFSPPTHSHAKSNQQYSPPIHSNSKSNSQFSASNHASSPPTHSNAKSSQQFPNSTHASSPPTHSSSKANQEFSPHAHTSSPPAHSTVKSNQKLSASTHASLPPTHSASKSNQDFLPPTHTPSKSNQQFPTSTHSSSPPSQTPSKSSQQFPTHSNSKAPSSPTAHPSSKWSHSGPESSHGFSSPAHPSSPTPSTASRPSSPCVSPVRGKLAFLASRRGSRESGGDVSPNFSPQASQRGRSRRQSNFLELPVADYVRPRVCSLPEGGYNPRSGSGDDIYRLRTFSITSKGVVNCGDALIPRRSKSNLSMNSTSPNSRQSNASGERSPFEGSCCGSSAVSTDDEMNGVNGAEAKLAKYRVVLLGCSGVGKSALVSQFMTSEYINTYDVSLDDDFGERTVSVQLEETESELVFIDHPFSEMSVENSISTYDPHATIVVYSVTDRSSYRTSNEILRYLWQEGITQERAVILVGNKCDLARARVVSTQEGKSLACAHDCKFIETSSGIQHNVDELLVGSLKQCRLREEKMRKEIKKTNRKNKLHSSRTSLSLHLAKEILGKLCLQNSKSKSCENLHVL